MEFANGHHMLLMDEVNNLEESRARKLKAKAAPLRNRKRDFIDVLKSLNPQDGYITLCDCCIRMTMTAPGIQSMKEERGYLHHNRQELTICSRTGCPFCFRAQVIWKETWPLDGTGTLVFNAIERDSSRQRPWDFRRLVARVYDVEDGSWILKNVTEPIFFRVSSSEPMSDSALQSFLVHKQTKIIDPTLSESMQQIQKGLNQRRESHNKCSAAQDPFSPTRVLDLDTGNGSVIKLHTTQLSHRVPYVALSYCWGGAQPYVTTLENIGQGYKAISVATLPTTIPTTIQDAVYVTRNVGYRYLWIDALCIIQNSDEDKSREIGMMGKIYKNSALTIVAASAIGVNEGFLGKIPVRKDFHIPVAVTGQRFSSILVSASDQARKEYIDENGFLNFRVESDPLEKRAWCLQELLLSPRLLEYTGTGVYFSCSSQKMIPDQLRIKRIEPLPSICLDMIEQNTPAYHVWHRIVGDYSKREITFPSDRAKAISGIAAELSYVLKDEYLAGLWRGSLILDLLWFLSDSSKIHQKWEYPASSTPGTPSWSWLSSSYQVKYRKLGQPVTEVLNCMVNLADPLAKFGDTNGGLLTISCYSATPRRLAQIAMQLRKNSTLPGRGDAAHYRFDFGYLARLPLNDVWGSPNDELEERFELILLACDHEKTREGQGSVLFGLILENLGANGTYARRGVWDIVCYNYDLTSLFKHPHDENVARFDPKRYFRII